MKKLLFILLGLMLNTTMYSQSIEPTAKKKSKEVIYLDAAKGLLFTYLGINHMCSGIGNLVHYYHSPISRREGFAISESSIAFVLAVYGMKLLNNTYANLAQLTE